MGQGLHHSALVQDGYIDHLDVRNRCHRLGGDPNVRRSAGARDDSGHRRAHWLCVRQVFGREHRGGLSAGQS